MIITKADSGYVESLAVLRCEPGEVGGLGVVEGTVAAYLNSGERKHRYKVSERNAQARRY